MAGTTTIAAATSPHAPDPRILLPPLLACLPTAAFSSRAPPALPPLLTPILRQRLSVFEKSPQAGSWLKLLNWRPEQAAKLPSIVECMNLEAHPVSGEPEIQDVGGIQYKRLDTETLHARLQVDEFNLEPIYLWCMAGSHQGAGWLLTELKPLEDEAHSEVWYDSITEAEKSFQQSQSQPFAVRKPSVSVAANDEDDSAYWAAYDMDEGRTPGISTKPSPAPGRGRASTAPGRFAESDYFARYASEVQPAMDPYDTDEDNGNMPESTLNHHQRDFSQITDSSYSLLNGFSKDASATNGASANMVISVPNTPPAHQPNPRSPTQSSPRSIKALEAEAERQSLAEIGIKQHISTDFKSLFRLARSAGISREEFERIVKRELEVLPLMDMD